ncbi:nucleolus and neural progenitor protein-like [Daphnia carinata]|uniref:nucleolus and neural progenitor protein-like n=1 Tax=Daphnia carinata TaxID=120202 RepID=UPI00257A0EDF|nr:nucleolus and neural progenitor protein-like [Daphnia carinata]
MTSVPLWNQSHLPSPATSAHKISAQFQGIMNTFLEDLSEKSQKLKDFMSLITSEVVLLTRFLYKLRAVFAHDKSYRVLKHIQKMVNKLLETNLVSDLASFQEQHLVSLKTVSAIFVAPKPKYEYIQVRLQGITRLLAQILCLSQHYGTLMIQKMQLGHFMSIVVISMSFVSRIWALSLHTMYFLMQLFGSISSICHTEGLVPNSTVNFLSKGCTIPLSLEDWLQSDHTLVDIHPLLKKRHERERTSNKPNIWQSIKIEDDEKHCLFQLKELVDTASLSEMKKNNDNLQESNVELIGFNKLKSMNNADIGELLTREPPLPVTKSRKRKLTTKNKGNQLEN